MAVVEGLIPQFASQTGPSAQFTQMDPKTDPHRERARETERERERWDETERAQ